MKKSFVYLIIVLMLSSVLCACGMDDKDGVIGASPRPTEAIDIIPSVVPDASSSMIPSIEPSATSNPDVKSPQVGATDGARVTPGVDNKTDKK